MPRSYAATYLRPDVVHLPPQAPQRTGIVLHTRCRTRTPPHAHYLPTPLHACGAALPLFRFGSARACFHACRHAGAPSPPLGLPLHYLWMVWFFHRGLWLNMLPLRDDVARHTCLQVPPPTFLRVGPTHHFMPSLSAGLGGYRGTPPSHTAIGIPAITHIAAVNYYLPRLLTSPRIAPARGPLLPALPPFTTHTPRASHLLDTARVARTTRTLRAFCASRIHRIFAVFPPPGLPSRCRSLPRIYSPRLRSSSAPHPVRPTFCHTSRMPSLTAAAILFGSPPPPTFACSQTRTRPEGRLERGAHFLTPDAIACYHPSAHTT